MKKKRDENPKNIFFRKVEYFVDKSIPYILVLLIILLVIEFFFQEIALQYSFIITILHDIIIADFIIDLIFKYLRVRNFKRFLKESWLDIIAIFPFYLIFRLVEEFVLLARATEELTRWQGVFHISRETEVMVATLEKSGKIESLERLSRFRRILRPVLRLPRVIKAAIFFEKPKKH